MKLHTLFSSVSQNIHVAIHTGFHWSFFFSRIKESRWKNKKKKADEKQKLTVNWKPCIVIYSRVSSPLLLLTFGLMALPCRGLSVHLRMLSSIPGIQWLNASSILPTLHHITPNWEPQIYSKLKGKIKW